MAGRSVLIMDSPDDCGMFMNYGGIIHTIIIMCFIHIRVVCSYCGILGKGGHENSLINGNSGDPVAFGEIVRQKNGVKKGSTTRQNTFFSQVTSSRIVAPTAEGGDQLHGNDDNDDHDDSFFKDQGEFEDPPAE